MLALQCTWQASNRQQLPQGDNTGRYHVDVTIKLKALRQGCSACTAKTGRGTAKRKEVLPLCPPAVPLKLKKPPEAK